MKGENELTSMLTVRLSCVPRVLIASSAPLASNTPCHTKKSKLSSIPWVPVTIASVSVTFSLTVFPSGKGPVTWRVLAGLPGIEMLSAMSKGV